MSFIMDPRPLKRFDRHALHSSMVIQMVNRRSGVPDATAVLNLGLQTMIRVTVSHSFAHGDKSRRFRIGFTPIRGQNLSALLFLIYI